MEKCETDTECLPLCTHPLQADLQPHWMIHGVLGISHCCIKCFWWLLKDHCVKGALLVSDLHK